MNTLQQVIEQSFRKEDIKITLSPTEINLEQTGINFFANKKDVQFYLFGEEMGLTSLRAFNKKQEMSLASLIALCYYHGELGSKTPTHVVCITGARGIKERNDDGTFNGTIYPLSENQLTQIYSEYYQLAD